MDEWITEIGRHINGWAGVVVVVKHITDIQKQVN